MADHFSAPVNVGEPAEAVVGCLEFFEGPEIGASYHLTGVHHVQSFSGNQTFPVPGAVTQLKESVFCHIGGAGDDAACGRQGIQAHIACLHVSGSGEYIAFGGVFIFRQGIYLKIAVVHAQRLKDAFLYQLFPGLPGQDLCQIASEGDHLVGILQDCPEISAGLEILKGPDLLLPIFQSVKSDLHVVPGDAGPVAEKVPGGGPLRCDRVPELQPGDVIAHRSVEV